MRYHHAVNRQHARHLNRVRVAFYRPNSFHDLRQHRHCSIFPDKRWLFSSQGKMFPQGVRYASSGRQKVIDIGGSKERGQRSDFKAN